MEVKLHRYTTSNSYNTNVCNREKKTYIDNADLRTDQRVNCEPGPQVWSAVYPLVGPQVRILPVFLFQHSSGVHTTLLMMTFTTECE